MQFQNRTSAWVLSCKFAACFQNTFSYEHIWGAAFSSVNLSIVKKSKIVLHLFHYKNVDLCGHFRLVTAAE